MSQTPVFMTKVSDVVQKASLPYGLSDFNDNCPMSIVNMSM